MADPRKIAGYGWRPDTPDHRDRLYHLDEPVIPHAQLPATADLTAQMPAVYDQGQLGSCTGNGIAALLEYRQAQQYEGSVVPSRLFIYYEERVIEGTVRQDAGAEIRDGIKVAASKGVPPETDWPYDIARFARKPLAKAYRDAVKHEALKYRRVIPGGGSMRSAIASGYPIVFGFTVPASFEDGSWDPASVPLQVPRQDDRVIGGHCVVAVGYDYSRTRFPDCDVYRCRNSWGPDWGDGGYFWMDARWFGAALGLTDDLWVITQMT